ncbi:hypothetical protein, partial [Candidatus Rickettsia kedanie]|uniref:hypothetical protein n=1 Tax=Candidatus Rickettsia kedanie TaxID=3115352 RepID=UPI00399D34BD
SLLLLYFFFTSSLLLLYFFFTSSLLLLYFFFTSSLLLLYFFFSIDWCKVARNNFFSVEEDSMMND